MKMFKFSLQKVQDARDAYVTRNEAELAAALSVERRLRKLVEERKEHLVDAIKKAEKDSGTVSAVREWATHHLWINHMRSRLGAARQDVAEQMLKVERARNNLRRALVDSKTMERMALRERQEWVMKARHEERKYMDEMAAVAYRRKATGSM